VDEIYVAASQGWGCKVKLAKLDDDERRAAIIGIGIDELRPVSAVLLDQPLAQTKRAATKVLKAGQWPRLFFGLDGQGRPQLKRYLEDVKKGQVATTYWADDDWASPLLLGAISWDHKESGHSQSGINELTAIVGAGP
jgi:adenine-specific DNA-methyltransferase